MKPEKIAQGWRYYRDKNNVDLSIRMTAGLLEEAILTFLAGGTYVEVRYKNGKVSTTCGESNERWSSELVYETDGLDHWTLCRGHKILKMYVNFIKDCDLRPLIEIIEKHMEPGQ